MTDKTNTYPDTNLAIENCSSEQLSAVAFKFSKWLELVGYKSYDPYDIWGTGYGRIARRLYYAKNPLGTVLTAPVILLEILCPSLRVLFVKKDRYATADAQLLLSFLNLYETALKSSMLPSASGSSIASIPAETWLNKAKGLAQDLLTTSIPGYHGHCWGYPFDWQNVNGLMPKYTPHITATPYAYEAFARLFDLTGDVAYLEVARSASAFVYHDLNDTPTGPDSCASSYSPMDTGKVVNANAYRAWVLFDAARRFSNEKYLERAWQNLRFILQCQEADGSWLYAIDNPGEAFIDHFHTCFVLKKLYKINCFLNDASVSQAIRNGYQFYRSHLYDRDDNPRSFALAPRLQIVQLEMYNYAEAITLGALLRDEIPEAFELARKLARRLGDRYQLRNGHFVTRIYLGGWRHTFPFLRWPQAQLFHAVTKLLAVMNGVR